MIEQLLGLFGFGPDDHLFGAVRSSEWPLVRAQHIRLYPSCAACGCTKDLEVHHELPVHFPGGKERELDPTNLITLCGDKARKCHLVIGHLCYWKARNPNVVRMAADLLRAIKFRECPKLSF